MWRTSLWDSGRGAHASPRHGRGQHLRSSSFVEGWQPGSSQVLNGHVDFKDITSQASGLRAALEQSPTPTILPVLLNLCSSFCQTYLTLVRIAWPVFEARTSLHLGPTVLSCGRVQHIQQPTAVSRISVPPAVASSILLTYPSVCCQPGISATSLYYLYCCVVPDSGTRR